MSKTLHELADDLADGRTCGRELVEAALARIADPAGEGSRAFLRVDAQAALVGADVEDRLRKLGRPSTPFAGIPISVKDLFDLEGETTTAGSTVLRRCPAATRDAPAVARLKAMGFIVLGRVNMTEFAFSGVGLNPHYGTPLSVWDRRSGRIPGGSSSGSAVAVAEGMCALSIGTDTGGSCRIPAAFNGIVGWKPSVGRVPREGVYPLAPSLDSVGPLAPSVRCAALADAAMAGEADGRIADHGTRPIRLALPQALVLDALDPEVAGDFERALTALGEAGVRIDELPFPELAELPAINRKGGIAAAEAFVQHRALLAARGAEYDPRVAQRIRSGAQLTAAELIEIQRRRQALIGLAGRLLAGFDAMVMPTAPIVAPPVAALEADEDYRRINFLCLRNTFVGNFLDGCSISLPMHRAGEPPTGLMLTAPHGRDRQLLAVAAAVEEALARERGRPLHGVIPGESRDPLLSCRRSWGCHE